MTYLKKENIYFYMVNACFFSCCSLYFGFMIMFLTANGYDSFQCGVINSMISLAVLLFQPIAGYFTDTFITIKKYIIISCCCAMATTFLLPLTVHNFFLASLSIIILSICSMPIGYLADTWLITLRETKPYIDYGKNRSGGSLGYAVTAFIAGNLISRFSYSILFTLHIFIFAFVILFVSLIPSVPCKNAKINEENKQSLSFLQIMKVLVKNQRYMIFLFSCFCFYMALKTYSTYITYKVIDLGGANTEVGYAIGISAFAEIPVFFALKSCIKRFKLSYIYFACMLALLLRSACMYFAQSIFGVMLSQVLSAVAFAFFLSICLEYISRIISGNIRATAITFHVAITNGLAGIIGTLIGGYLVQKFSVNFMILVMTIVNMIAILIFLIPTLKSIKTNPESVI